MDEDGPRSFGSYPDFRKLSRGDVRDERSMSVYEYVFFESRRGGTMGVK